MIQEKGEEAKRYPGTNLGSGPVGEVVRGRLDDGSRAFKRRRRALHVLSALCCSTVKTVSVSLHFGQTTMGGMDEGGTRGGIQACRTLGIGSQLPSLRSSRLSGFASSYQPKPDYRS